jgi:hypothetical protein
VITRSGRRGLAVVVVTAAASLTLTTITFAGPMNAEASSRRSVASRRLPPAGYKALARIFDPALRTLGLRTSRAMLQNIKTYTRDPHGSHLALYAEPISTSYTDREYVAHFVPVARVFLPSIFKRWKGLQSFDVCQEPRPGEDPRREPPPVTQLYVTRAGAAKVRWNDTTIADLLEASTHTRPATKTTGAGSYVLAYFLDRLNAQPALVRAKAALRARTSTTTTIAPATP